MLRRTTVILLILCLPCLPATAAELSVTSDTLFQLLERDTPLEKDQSVAPIYEYLSVDYQNLEEGGFSLHAYGWGRTDTGGSDYFTDDPDGELHYAYLQFAKPYSPWRARLGRQHIFAGVTNDTVDGLSVDAAGSAIAVSAFGGVPATFDEDNGISGDAIAGGRIAVSSGSLFELGASIQYLADDATEIENLVGADATLALGGWGDVTGLSAFNYDTNQWQEHRYEAYLRMGPMVLKPMAHYFRYDDYFGERSKRDPVFGYLTGTGETLTVFGADGHWSPSSWFDIGARYRQYAYALRDDGAHYYALLGRLVFEQDREIGGEAGRMDGEQNESAYVLSRIYGQFPNPFGLSPNLTLSADFQWVQYDAPIYGQDQSYEGSASASHSFFSDLFRITATGRYSQNPYYDQDLSALMALRIEY